MTSFAPTARSKQAECYATAPQGNVAQASHKYVTKLDLSSSNVTNMMKVRGGGRA